MRHILLSGAITLTAPRVRKAPTPTRLVAPARFAHPLTPGRPRTIPGAINLPVITMTANYYLRAAQPTHKDPSRRFHRRPTSRQSDIDRDLRLVEYSPCTRAQHGVGHDIGVNLEVWAGVVPALLGSGLFTPSRTGLSCPPCGRRSQRADATKRNKYSPHHSADCALPPDLRGFAPPFTLNSRLKRAGSLSGSTGRFSAAFRPT